MLVAGLATTLAADPPLGATTISLTSVTTVNVNDFIRIGTTLTEAACEVVKVTTVGTAGGGNTIVENSAGGGLLIDHGNGENVKTVTGTILAAPAVAGATNIKVDAVTGSDCSRPATSSGSATSATTRRARSRPSGRSARPAPASPSPSR